MLRIETLIDRKTVKKMKAGNQQALHGVQAA